MSELLIDPNPTEDDCECFFGWLREFNLENNESFRRLCAGESAQPLVLIARNAKGEPVGGLQGETRLDWLKIDLMSVAPERRGQGIGTALMNDAERIAKERGCQRAYIDTMSYQAPVFYAGLAYVEAGRIRNWDSHGHDKVFYTKEL